MVFIRIYSSQTLSACFFSGALSAWIPVPDMVDHTGQIPCTEAVVDVDDAHPLAQELSMDNSAAKPPKLAPYPTLVGTAITGSLPARP